MIRKLLFITLTVGLAFAIGSAASAAPVNNYTELANYTQAGGGGMTFAPPNQAINFSNSSNGATYINTYDSTSLSNGSHFKSVGAIPIGSILINGMPSQPSQTTGTVVAVFGLQGVTNTTTGAVTIQQGAVKFYLTTSAFTQNNLATWGAGSVTNGVFTAATPLASYVLKSGVLTNTTTSSAFGNEQVVTGNPNSYNSFAAGKGPSIVNLAATPAGGNNFTGTTLFRDAGAFTGLNFTPTADVFSNRTTDGITVGANTFLLPGQVSDFTDAFANSSNQNLDPTSTGNSGNSVNNLIIMNGILTNFGTDPGLVLPDGTVLAGTNLLLDGGFAFASTFNNPADPKAYSPNLTNGLTLTGDFASVTNTASGIAPTLEPGQVTPGVPEIDPNSIAGALTLLAGGLLYLTDRCRRLKK